MHAQILFFELTVWTFPVAAFAAALSFLVTLGLYCYIPKQGVV
jgi:hypothetical protein